MKRFAWIAVLGGLLALTLAAAIGLSMLVITARAAVDANRRGCAFPAAAVSGSRTNCPSVSGGSGSWGSGPSGDSYSGAQPGQGDGQAGSASSGPLSFGCH